jgi:Methyltransferase domain
MIPYLLRKFRFVRRLERRVRDLSEHASRLEGENARIVAEMDHWRKFAPPGHYNSPLPSIDDIADASARKLFDPRLHFPGLDLREAEQEALGREFGGYYGQQPFPESPTPGWRYYLNNPSYGHHDAIILYCMLRHLNPRRVIEVGSGFSSAAMLDLNARVMEGRIRLTFIDPDMTRLLPLLQPDDRARVTLVEQRVQDVPLDRFSELEANDVLFIDSSHVNKLGSDANFLLFEVLPTLRAGVHVHIHDISGNLEYPRAWYEEGRAWNEIHVLRAFLMYNRAFRIKFFSMWFYNKHFDYLSKHMPLCAKGRGGQIWLRRDAGP